MDLRKIMGKNKSQEDLQVAMSSLSISNCAKKLMTS